LSNLNSGCADAAGILILVKWKVDYWKSFNAHDLSMKDNSILFVNTKGSTII
jgi:hypothetical protein